MVNQWGTEPPTENGYYWVRKYRRSRSNEPLTQKPTLVKTEGKAVIFFDAYESDWIREYEGEWYGPIEPPQG